MRTSKFKWIQDSALRYKTRSEWRENDKVAYNAAQRFGGIDKYWQDGHVKMKKYDQIHKKYGSVENYLHDLIKVNQ